MEVLEEPRIQRHCLTVEQYHRMGEAGVFAPDARVELIDGEVIDRAPMLRVFAEPDDGDYERVEEIASPSLLPITGLDGVAVDLSGVL